MTGLQIVFDELFDRCQGQPDLTAIVETSGHTLTYRDLHQHVDTAAAQLTKHGLRPGDRVLFAVRPSIESIVLILAILRAGGVLVAADPTMGDELFHSRVAIIQPSWVIAESALLALTRHAPVRRLLLRRGVSLPPIATVRDVTFIRVGPLLPLLPRSLSYASLLRLGAPRVSPTLNPEDEAFIVFTSGTTSDPKAVVHTGRSLAAMVATLTDHLQLQHTDVVYSGELHLIVPALLAGSLVVIPRHRQVTPQRLVADYARWGVTHTFGTPNDFLQLIEHLSTRGESLSPAMKAIMLGAAPIYGPFLDRIKDVIAPTTRVWCAYAMTEMLPVALVDLREKLAFYGEGDLVGRPLPGVRAELDAVGQLLLSGPHLFRGYLGHPPVTKHATGDLARLDDEGRIVLLGREKDMLIRRHHNIYPALYEPTINRIPGVRRCSIVGLYDHQLADERVVLALEPESWSDTDALLARVQRELREGPNRIDSTALPDHVVLTTIPVSGRSKKVDRRALAEQVAAQLIPA